MPKKIDGRSLLETTAATAAARGLGTNDPKRIAVVNMEIPAPEGGEDSEEG